MLTKKQVQRLSKLAKHVGEKEETLQMLQKIKDFLINEFPKIENTEIEVEIESNEIVTVAIKRNKVMKLKYKVAYKNFGTSEVFVCALFELIDGKEECHGQYKSQDWHGMADRVKLGKGWIEAYL